MVVVSLPIDMPPYPFPPFPTAWCAGQGQVISPRPDLLESQILDAHQVASPASSHRPHPGQLSLWTLDNVSRKRKHNDDQGSAPVKPSLRLSNKRSTQRKNMMNKTESFPGLRRFHWLLWWCLHINNIQSRDLLFQSFITKPPF